MLIQKLQLPLFRDFINSAAWARLTGRFSNESAYFPWDSHPFLQISYLGDILRLPLTMSFL